MVALVVVQVAAVVNTSVLPSLYVPVATKGRVVPRAKDGFAGVTAIETSAACPTVRAAEAVMEPEVAVMVAAPGVTPVANPPLLIVAIVVAEEAQATLLVRFCVVPLL
jgi:hypothetical protein